MNCNNEKESNAKHHDHAYRVRPLAGGTRTQRTVSMEKMTAGLARTMDVAWRVSKRIRDHRSFISQQPAGALSARIYKNVFAAYFRTHCTFTLTITTSLFRRDIMRDPYAYPAPFPREATRSAISLTSSSPIANALSANPDYPIYMTGPPVNNPAYPYPARNVLNPNTYPYHTPMVMKRDKQGEDRKHSQRRSGTLTEYRALPQLYSPVGYQVGAQLPPIQFQRRNSSIPFAIKELLSIADTFDLAGRNDNVFEGYSEPIEVKISWPGYERYATKKHIPPGGGGLTRSMLLVLLVHQIIKFARYVRDNNIRVQPGQEQWSMECNNQTRHTFWENCVITTLRHCGGSRWEPEILCPSR
ncbi:hypothetical protein EDC04DRAFT_967675 [Pisolithus marmoratus]|nr:hypothetical protein EDC04DRAFT_967675 [Pisolithus marmoratus]